MRILELVGVVYVLVTFVFLSSVAYVYRKDLLRSEKEIFNFLKL